MDIREYTFKDSECTVELIRQFFEDHLKFSDPDAVYNRGDAEEDLKEWLSYPNSVLFVLDDSGIKAFLRLRVESKNVFWIEDIGVERSVRGQHYGKQLLQFAEDYVQERGAKSLFTNISVKNLASIHFFSKNGFNWLNMVELRKNFYEHKEQETINLLGETFKIG
ncbi:MAG: GNAT family N-acetyltransferase [Theionarchaea archaeon]|nr:GNAT family N-acetyltransferase [Theionarchaea archaeon]